MSLQHQINNRILATSSTWWLSLVDSTESFSPTAGEMAFLREQEEIASQVELAWDEDEEREMRFPFMGWSLEKQYAYGLKYAWDMCGNQWDWRDVFGIWKH
jgi:hypothetical protein